MNLCLEEGGHRVHAIHAIFSVSQKSSFLLYIKSVIPCELSKRRCTIYLKLKGSYRVYQLCDIEL